MKYGIYFAYWEKQWNADYLRYIRKVKSLGFDVLEISCAGIRSLSKNELAALRDEAADCGVILTAGYGPTKMENLASEDNEVIKNAMAFYTDILKRLEFLRIHTIGGGIYSYWPVDYSKPIDKRGDWERSVKNVRAVSKIAEECGVEYCLEVLNRFEGYLLNTAEEAVQFTEEVGSPSVKVMLDTFHMNIEEDSMVGAILTAGGRLGHLHVGENNRRVPGKGGMPWSEIGEALRRIGYDKAVVMEPFVLQGGEIGSDIKVWRDICINPSESRLDNDAKNSVSFLRRAFSGH